jgi:hypothetical protein
MIGIAGSSDAKVSDFIDPQLAADEDWQRQNSMTWDIYGHTQTTIICLDRDLSLAVGNAMDIGLDRRLLCSMLLRTNELRGLMDA